LLNQNWNFYNLFYDVLDVSVDSYDFGYDFLYFNNFWYIDSLLNKFLDFVNFGNLSDSINNFFNDLLDLLNFLNNPLNRNDFLSPFFNLNYSVLDIRNNLLHLLDSFLDNDIINMLFNLNNPNFFLFYWNNSVSNFINLFNLSMNNLNRNHFLNNSINRYLYFNRYDDISIDFNDFRLLNNISDNLLHF